MTVLANSRTHNLNNKKLYPHHYVYLSSQCINIYSEVEIRVGDKVRINGKLAILGKNYHILGIPKLAKYYSGSFYEFTYKFANQ